MLGTVPLQVQGWHGGMTLPGCMVSSGQAAKEGAGTALITDLVARSLRCLWSPCTQVPSLYSELSISLVEVWLLFCP